MLFIRLSSIQTPPTYSKIFQCPRIFGVCFYLQAETVCTDRLNSMLPCISRLTTDYVVVTNCKITDPQSRLYCHYYILWPSFSISKYFVLQIFLLMFCFCWINEKKRGVDIFWLSMNCFKHYQGNLLMVKVTSWTHTVTQEVAVHEQAVNQRNKFPTEQKRVSRFCRKFFGGTVPSLRNCLSRCKASQSAVKAN